MNRFTIGSTILGCTLLAGTALAFDHHGAMADKSAADTPSSDQPVTDTWITTKVKADLLATDGVTGTDIRVDTKDGVVTLSGSVATKAERSKAADVAKAIKGVKKVDDKLEVSAKKGR